MTVAFLNSPNIATLFHSVVDSAGARLINLSRNGGRHKGNYRSSHVVHNIYDVVQTAVRTQPFQAHLDLPTGLPSDVARVVIPIAKWNLSNSSQHYHRPER